MSNQAYNEIYGARADGVPMTGEASSTSMLDMMRDRLASLSDEARSIRGQVPHEFEPDVERIQQQMQRLGERLSDLSRGALVPYSAAQRAGERRSKEVRFVTEDDVRVGRAQPDQVIALGSPAGQRRAEARYDSNAWDDAAANALAELYESGEAFAVHARREGATVAAASVRSTARAVSNRASDRPQYAAAMGGGMPSPQAAPRGCAMDSNLLDQRFAEIAARIEESLRQIRPEAALASLTNRFDQLETQINTMIGQMATRADLEELRVAEAQIEEIATQLNQLRRQMARLDMIDAHLGTLTSQLSDERLTRLFNEGVQVTADVGRLDAIDAQLRMIAVQLSDERLSGLVSRSSAHDVDYDEVAQSAAQRVAASFAANSHERDTSAREIGEVRGMLESLINERRHNDENNASMLETMQQAIIRVLDRIDALEVTPPQVSMQPSAPASMMAQPERPQQQPVANAAPTPPAPPVAATPAPVSYDDDLIPATATVFAEMRGLAEVAGTEVGEASDFLPPEEAEASPADMEAFMADEVRENAAPPRIPVYTTSSFNLDEAFSSARNAEALSFGEPQPAKRPIEVLRHDFIADAHRAKLKAASKPDVSDDDLRSGELSVGTREQAAKPRRRSIFSFRSQRVAMTLLVLLAAIPAAIFFMPRTNVDHLDAATPAAVTLDPAAAGHAAEEPMDAEPMIPAQPRVVPPLNAPSKQTRQDMQTPLPSTGEQGYEDANAVGAPIDTASLPDGIALQNADVGPSGAQVAQFNEQARMAHLSGQVGIAAAHATPAALMQDQLLRESGVDTADSGAVTLPPATVGPYSLRLAAAQGDVSAQFEVASRLAEGKGTDQDLIEAAQWYQRAASKGFPMAQFRLGTLYERGIGVKADPQRAQVWYERAAVQGNVKAMHNLAVLLASRTPKPDYKSAARWFTAAADYGLGDSQFNLAVLYENGMGVAKDQQQAYKWLVLAAKSGDKDAAARRDSLKAKLSAGDVAAAETAAKDWRAKAMPNMANDARLAGQAWRDGTRRG